MGLNLLRRVEFLRPAAEADLRGVEITLGIDADVVHPLELAGLAAVPAPLRQRLAVLARYRDDLAIGAIGDEDEALLRVARKHQVPDRAVLQGLRLDAKLLHEGAVLAKHLDAVVDPVADINETVVRQPHTMHGIAEALRGRRLGIVCRQLVVGRRLFPVGAPMALVGSGIGIEHDDAAVLVAVGHIQLARRVVDHHVGGAAELGIGIRSAGRARLADLQQEVSIRREFQDLVILLVVAGEPDISGSIDGNAVLALGPVVALPGPAPGCQQISLAVELEHRRCGLAAFGGRRIRQRALLVVDESAGAVNDPDVIAPCRLPDRRPGRGSSSPATASARTDRP